MQTSELISAKYPSQLPIIPIPDLQAQSFGILEGQRVSLARTDPKLQPYLYEFIPPDQRYFSAPPGGESLEDLADRTTNFIMRMKTNFNPKGLLLVTHQSVLRAVHGKLKGIAPELWDSTVTIPHSSCLAISSNLDKIHLGSLLDNNFQEV